MISGVNEFTPVFGSDPYVCNIDEDAAINDNVQLVACTDTDDISTGDGRLLVMNINLIHLLKVLQTTY